MRRMLSVLAPSLAMVCGLIFAAQTPTPFPQTLPANSVVGRLGGGVPGPAEAIPFATLSAQLATNSQFTAIGVGGTVPASGIEIYNNVPAITADGQMGLGTSSTLGALLIGRGSGFDFVLQNKNSSSVCSIATGTTTITCTNLALINVLPPSSGGTNNAFFGVAGPATTAKTFTFPNSSQNVAMLDLAGQVVSGGATVTAFDNGTKSSGTFTVDCSQAPLQKVTDNGAFTLAAPASDSSCMLLVTNGASAGAITFSGFSVGANVGDTITTTNTQKFTISIWRINSISGYRIAAHQ